MKILTRVLLASAGLLVSALALSAQDTPPPTDTPPADAPPAEKPPKRRGPSEHASDNAKAVHALLDQFKAQRDEFMAARRALIERLRNATEEEKRAILEQLKAEQKERVAEQRALGKQIRDELKKLREERRNGGTDTGGTGG